jgi:hypothetical protein
VATLVPILQGHCKDFGDALFFGFNIIDQSDVTAAVRPRQVRWSVRSKKIRALLASRNDRSEAALELHSLVLPGGNIAPANEAVPEATLPHDSFSSL